MTGQQEPVYRVKRHLHPESLGSGEGPAVKVPFGSLTLFAACAAYALEKIRLLSYTAFTEYSQAEVWTSLTPGGRKEYPRGLSDIIDRMSLSEGYEIERLDGGHWQPISLWRLDELRRAADLAGALAGVGHEQTSARSKQVPNPRGRPRHAQLTPQEQDILKRVKELRSKRYSWSKVGQILRYDPKTLQRWQTLNPDAD